MLSLKFNFKKYSLFVSELIEIHNRIYYSEDKSTLKSLIFSQFLFLIKKKFS